MQSTYMNANGVSNVVISQMNQLETGLTDSVCCEQSADSAEDPLIEACTSGEPETVVEYTFSEGECSSITTTTTVFLDNEGNEKATREEV